MDTVKAKTLTGSASMEKQQEEIKKYLIKLLL
jgi:hypothetical protein